jgi:dephospho-CoA kinase
VWIVDADQPKAAPILLSTRPRSVPKPCGRMKRVGGCCAGHAMKTPSVGVPCVSGFIRASANFDVASVREICWSRGKAYARNVLVVGLTGGIGSGKSTVSAMLAEMGALVIDADAITKELQQPGHEVFDAMVERFGPVIVAADGTLDRPAVAAIVFADEQARRDLEAIVHPAVGAVMLKTMQSVAETDRVVVYDVPLLVESARKGYGAVIVVDVDPEVAVRRLVEQREMDERDARARIANQASREDRIAAADRVIDNSGTIDDLRRQVDEVWAWIETLPHP